MSNAKELFPGECTNGWCQASTRRLLVKLASHKPAGLAKHFHLMCLVDYLNHIYEDETDIIFEEYLSPENLSELRKRMAQPPPNKTTGLMKFPPSYQIRPNAKQIQEKLDELYGMDIVEANELIPEEVNMIVDYELPDYVLDMPDLPDVESIATTPSPQPPATPAAVTGKKGSAASRKAAATPRAADPTTAAAGPRRSSSRTSAAPAAVSSSPAPQRRSTPAEKPNTQLFPPPAPQRATRAAAAAAAAAANSGKRRSAVSTVSPSPSPRSSRSSTPASAKRER